MSALHWRIAPAKAMAVAIVIAMAKAMALLCDICFDNNAKADLLRDS